MSDLQEVLGLPQGLLPGGYSQKNTKERHAGGLPASKTRGKITIVYHIHRTNSWFLVGIQNYV